MELRRTPFYRVLYRPPLVFGGEREPVLLTLATAIGLVVTGQNLVSIVVGAVVWFGGITAWRLMAKADPYMTSVYRRQLQYRAYYAPRSRPARTE
jgi:type IV secretory pathway TrbD component